MSRRRTLRRGLLGLLVAVGALALAATLLVRGSLPKLDGEVVLHGLSGPVAVERDSLGVPRILASSRRDAARALGYLHGQDRFFQMDLMRRRAAGELAALLGTALLDTDRGNRRHGFRELAPRVVEVATDAQRELLEAYAQGINSGLESLRARPVEYLLLRQKPRPWTSRDCVLVIYSMYLELSLDTATAESMNGLVRDLLPSSLAEFLTPEGNPFEAPLTGGPFALPPMPAGVETAPDAAGQDGGSPSVERSDRAGSNSWAVGAAHSFDGRGLLANDMHLALGLPNIWYRAQMEWTGAGGELRRLVGVTLPGVPALVVGSNGHVAWGFTNSYGDFADLVEVEVDPADSTRYLTPDGSEPFGVRREVCEIAGARADTILVRSTQWGPLWDRDHRGQLRALRWTAHDVEATNFGFLGLEGCRDVEQAVRVAAGAGIPPQNFVCTDREGRVAWTLLGRIPRRAGLAARFPVEGRDPGTQWNGYLTPDEQPRIMDPPEGRLWTANARVVGGEMLRQLGDGGYALGARARQIRDDLRALSSAREADLLAVQLDDRALFLEQWRSLLMELFARRAPAAGSDAADFAHWIDTGWDGRASVESVGYRLVRSFRVHMIDAVYGHLAGPCYESDPGFRPGWLPHPSAVVLELLRRQPPGLQSPAHESWDAWMLVVVDECVREAREIAGDLREFRWGRRNTVRLRHPLTYAVPTLMRWFAYPPRELPGGSFMPRVQHPGHGASERMVVSPGHEEDGIFHMPGAQSGHPFSPYFRVGHRAWEEGWATPLLAGPAEHRLRLVASK